MDTFVDFISNAWTIGIGGGIVSGFIVFWVTNFFFVRREKKEYMQRVKTANNEILYAIRPLIVSQKIPEQIIIDSLILSTSRKYKVNTINLYTAKLLAEDLIKEVLDNAFLDVDHKLEYCSIVNKLVNQVKTKDLELIKNELNNTNSYEVKTNKFTEMSLILSAISAMLTLVLTLYGDKSESPIFTDFLSLLLPTAVVLLLTMIITILLRKKEYTKKEEKEKEKKCTA